MTAVELDVNAARLAHLRWELDLEALVAGSGTREPLRGHEDCILGTWLYGTGLHRYGKHASVWELKGVHKKFHHAAEETLAAMASGQATRAVATMESVRRLSGEILYLLTALELDVIEEAVESVRAKNIPSRLLRMFFPSAEPLDVIALNTGGSGPGERLALDVTRTRLAHLKWIRDLQKAFRGHGRNMRAQPSEECTLGIWIHGAAMKEMGATKDLKALDAAHKRFHHEVDVVLSSLAHRKLRRADEAYEVALVQSGEIVTLLTRLQLEFINSQFLSARSSTL